jgi:hypothetical protein
MAGSRALIVDLKMPVEKSAIDPVSKNKQDDRCDKNESQHWKNNYKL